MSFSDFMLLILMVGTFFCITNAHIDTVEERILAAIKKLQDEKENKNDKP